MHKKCRLLIPSAKIVPQELQKLGKLPAVIYPINQRITFDYIYEQYGEDCSGIDIVCYENADKIERRLKKMISSDVQLIKLPELKDLGYTIWFALQNRVDPIIINFADTIVLDSISKIEGDAFFCQEGLYDRYMDIF